MPPPSIFLKDFLGLIGEKVGPYVIRECVAMGGVAVVYRAEHETMKSSVAVKVLTPEVVMEAVRPTLEQLFLREAQILGQLRSDDTLRAFDHGRVLCQADKTERPYMVVEWLEGRVLSDEFDRRRRERRPYTLPEIVEILRPIARALDAAHAAGIVHRDVNPRNVFLEDQAPGRAPRARLIDFGFAKDVAAQAQGLHLQQVSGTLFARSPDYAAPEHYDRETYGELSENTDIYTFALIFVEALTLESPLRGDTPEVLAVATANEFDRPTPNARGANVSPEVEALFREALAVNQFERPGSVLEWFTRLEAAVAGPAARAPVAAPMPLSAPAAPEPAEPDAGVVPGLPGKSGVLPVVLTLLLFLAAGGAAAWFFFLRSPTCAAGFADCNGERADGCEVALDKSALHCGRCGNACPTVHGAPACVAGACRIAHCAEEYLRDCNGDPSDGCEIDVRGDLKNCGECENSCGNECAKKVSCEASECKLVCKSGCGDCDEKAANGCETTLTSDPANCGRCGLACSGTACGEGLCEPKRLATLPDPAFLTSSAGQVFWWERSNGTIRTRTPDGAESVLAESVQNVTGLAAGPDIVVWAAGEKGEVFAQLRSAQKPRRIAGPLVGPTPLSVAQRGRYVSWTSRTPAKAGKKPAAPGLSERVVYAAPLDATLIGTAARRVECTGPPSTFTGDAERRLCCAEGQQLEAFTCWGKCTPRRYFVRCPRELVLEGDKAYFVQDTRVMSLDLGSGQVQQLAKRRRRPGELGVDDSYVYWIEGQEDGEIWRAARSGKTLGEAEPLARRESRPRWLLVDDKNLLFTVAARGGAALTLLPLPQHRED